MKCVRDLSLKYTKSSGSRVEVWTWGMCQELLVRVAKKLRIGT